MVALTRRRILGGLVTSLALMGLLGRVTQAAPAARDGFVIVNGWVLRHSDLEQMR